MELGLSEGLDDGWTLGVLDGLSLGNTDGAALGMTEGWSDGSALGFEEGKSDGDVLGMPLGLLLGASIQIPPVHQVHSQQSSSASHALPTEMQWTQVPERHNSEQQSSPSTQGEISNSAEHPAAAKWYVASSCIGICSGSSWKASLTAFSISASVSATLGCASKTILAACSSTVALTNSPAVARGKAI